jgi:hypothetical protein
LLISHQEAVYSLFASDDLEQVEEAHPLEAEDNHQELLPVADEPEPGESKYAPLAIWLQNQSLDKEVIGLSFTNIQEIIGSELPISAYKNRSWWANDPVGHVQSNQWLDVGWRVAAVKMKDEIVRFARIKERNKAFQELTVWAIPSHQSLLALPWGTAALVLPIVHTPLKNSIQTAKLSFGS